MASSRSKLTVYVVDGDESARHGLARLMRSEGFEVRDFDGIDSFLDPASGPFPTRGGCVLLDVSMLDFDGAALRRRLTERGVGLPIIALTARGDDTWRREAKRLGAQALYRKPVDDRTLIDAIDWIVGSTSDAPRN